MASEDTLVRPGAGDQLPDALARVPLLEQGDRLTRAEFERRYAAMPLVKKAELIEGIVYMPSPVRNSHNEATSLVVWWLVTYTASTPGSRVGENGTVRLDLDNEVQPDALLRLVETAGGATRVGADDHIEGPPELVAEVAVSSASYDVHVKRRIYRRNGVREYLIWRVEDRVIDWFYLDQDDYVTLPVDQEGVVRSRVFPGLWLAVQALLEGDLATVLAALQNGLQSAGHIAFVKQLQQELSGGATDGTTPVKRGGEVVD